MQVVNFSQFSFLTALFTPLITLAAWLSQPSSTKALVPPANAPLAHQRLTLPFASAGGSRRKNATVSSFKSVVFKAQDRAAAPLKVVREQDAAMSPSCAGRMTISGRMTDVCAELDRMTELEEAL